jgi:hypothetical protein
MGKRDLVKEVIESYDKRFKIKPFKSSVRDCEIKDWCQKLIKYNLRIVGRSEPREIPQVLELEGKKYIHKSYLLSLIDKGDYIEV